jgi:hypothetical protein
MKLANRVANEAVSILEGTCRDGVTPELVLDALYNLKKISSKTHSTANADKLFLKIETIICEEVDKHIFLCDYCGWWCDEGDRSDGGECTDCADEN